MLSNFITTDIQRQCLIVTHTVPHDLIMSEVLTEFPAAVRIYGTECVAGRAPKIALKWAQGLDGAPHPGFGDSGTIRAGGADRNPRRPSAILAGIESGHRAGPENAKGTFF